MIRDFIEKLAKDIKENGLCYGNGISLNKFTFILSSYSCGYFLYVRNPENKECDLELLQEEFELLEKSQKVSKRRAEEQVVNYIMNNL